MCQHIRGFRGPIPFVCLTPLIPNPTKPFQQQGCKSKLAERMSAKDSQEVNAPAQSCDKVQVAFGYSVFSGLGEQSKAVLGGNPGRPEGHNHKPRLAKGLVHAALAVLQ